MVVIILVINSCTNVKHSPRDRNGAHSISLRRGMSGSAGFKIYSVSGSGRPTSTESGCMGGSAVPQLNPPPHQFVSSMVQPSWPTPPSFTSKTDGSAVTRRSPPSYQVKKPMVQPLRLSPPSHHCNPMVQPSWLSPPLGVS